MKYKYLEDEATADVAFISYGKSLEEAFTNSAQAVIELMIDSKSIDVQEVKRVSKSARDLKALLYDFLEEIIYFHDAENLVFKTVEAKRVYEENNLWYLEAVFKGEQFDKKKHKVGSPIKAITYFGMQIRQEKKQWIVKVTLDL